MLCLVTAHDGQFSPVTYIYKPEASARTQTRIQIVRASLALRVRLYPSTFQTLTIHFGLNLAAVSVPEAHS